MQIVIDIDDEMYKQIVTNDDVYVLDDVDCILIENAIANGTPLDLEGLKKDMKALNCGYPYGLDYLLDCLDKRLGITINGK